jgi:hypothetical protein
VVGGDADWAREVRRQLIVEIELVSSGLAEGGKLLHQDTPAEASDRIADLQRRLEQVDRLIEAIEVLRDDTEDDESDAASPDNAAQNGAMHGRKGRTGHGSLAN